MGQVLSCGSCLLVVQFVDLIVDLVSFAEKSFDLMLAMDFVEIVNYFLKLSYLFFQLVVWMLPY